MLPAAVIKVFKSRKMWILFITHIHSSAQKCVGTVRVRLNFCLYVTVVLQVEVDILSLSHVMVSLCILCGSVHADDMNC